MAVLPIYSTEKHPICQLSWSPKPSRVTQFLIRYKHLLKDTCFAPSLFLPFLNSLPSWYPEFKTISSSTSQSPQHLLFLKCRFSSRAFNLTLLQAQQGGEDLKSRFSLKWLRGQSLSWSLAKPAHCWRKHRWKETPRVSLLCFLLLVLHASFAFYSILRLKWPPFPSHSSGGRGKLTEAKTSDHNYICSKFRQARDPNRSDSNSPSLNHFAKIHSWYILTVTLTSLWMRRRTAKWNSGEGPPRCLS